MKVKITVPESLGDIKLSQYQEFLETTKGSENTDWVNKQMVGIFCDAPEITVKSLTKRQYNKILLSLNKIISEEWDEVQHTPIITHNGKQYGFIPDFDEISLGEQGDIDSTISDWQKMDRVMAVLYRPVIAKRKDKYLIKPYMEEIGILEDRIKQAQLKGYKRKVIKLRLKLSDEKERWEREESSLDVTMDVVSGALVFFCNLLRDLSIFTLSYTKDLIQTPQVSQLLEKNGVGIKTSIQSLEATFLGFHESLSLNYMRR